MTNFRGGLLASTGATALASARGWRFRAADGEEGGGGAAALLEEDVDGAPPAKDPPADPAAVVDPPADPALDFSWATGVKAEAAEGEDASNLDWLKGTKVKDLDSLVKIARDNQKALRESGRVKIPGEGAKPDEIKAYRDAMGVPEAPDGYEVKLPEAPGADKFELDTAFLDPLRQVAIDNNVPKAAFEALASKFLEGQLESEVATADANDKALGVKVKEWGTDAPARKEEFKRGAQILKLDKVAIGKIQSGFGVGETMDMIARIGSMAGEDFFSSGNAAQRFGVGDLDSAQKALDALINDPVKAKAISNQTDPALVAQYKRLQGAVAHFKSIAKN